MVCHFIFRYLPLFCLSVGWLSLFSSLLLVLLSAPLSFFTASLIWLAALTIIHPARLPATRIKKAIQTCSYNRTHSAYFFLFVLCYLYLYA